MASTSLQRIVVTGCGDEKRDEVGRGEAAIEKGNGCGFVFPEVTAGTKDAATNGESREGAGRKKSGLLRPLKRLPVEPYAYRWRRSASITL